MGARSGACAAAMLCVAAASSLAQSPPTPLPIELRGVMVYAAAPSRSACLVGCTNPAEPPRTSIVAVGQVACGRAEVLEVREDGVVVRDILSNRAERIAFRSGALEWTSAAAPATTTVLAPGTAPAEPDRIDVALPKDTLDRYLSNLPEVLSSALATPRMRATAQGSAIEGFEISRIVPGGAVDQLGLESGDVLLEVNGEPLDSLATVLQLLGQAHATPEARLTVLRAGRRLTITFRTR